MTRRALAAALVLVGALDTVARADRAAIVAPASAAPVSLHDALLFRRVSSSGASSAPGQGALWVGGQRALLMQLAHPKISKALARHSVLGQDPRQAFDRFARTTQLFTDLLVGSDEAADRAAAHIASAHKAVRERMQAAGESPTVYDPALHQWIMATIVDSTIVTYEALAAPLSRAEKDSFTREAFRRIGDRLKIPTSYRPDSYAEVHALIERQLPTLEVTDEARRMARTLLRPAIPAQVPQGLPVPRWTAPAVRPILSMLRPVGRVVTAELLPETLRQAYGLAELRPRKLTFQVLRSMSRGLHRVVRAAERGLPRAPGERATTGRVGRRPR